MCPIVRSTVSETQLPDTFYVFYLAGYLFDRKVPAPDSSIVGRGKLVCYFVGLAVLLSAGFAGKALLHDIGITLLIAGVALAWLAHVCYVYERVRSSVADRRSEAQ